MMDLMFRSTRNADDIVTASQAVLKGLAGDGRFVRTGVSSEA